MYIKVNAFFLSLAREFGDDNEDEREKEMRLARGSSRGETAASHGFFEVQRG